MVVCMYVSIFGYVYRLEKNRMLGKYVEEKEGGG